MKIRNYLFFATILFLSFVFQANAQPIEYYGGIDRENGGYRDFLEAHPDVVLKQSSIFYNTTGEFAGALLTKEFTGDLFELSTIQFDCQQIMKKGYCIDLSESQVIQDAVSRMHPLIGSQAMVNGKIFAVPKGIRFFYMQTNQEGWEAAGLSEEDIPDSFPAFLDFLERWCDRVETSTEQNIRIKLSWDAELYNEYSYATWLTELLIDSYITQLQFANEPLRFNDPLLSELLNRCNDIGVRIFNVEPRIGASGAQDAYELFENGLQSAWPQKASHILSFRINDYLPKTIKASLDMYAVNPSSIVRGLCIELVEKLVIGPDSPNKWTHALLYQSAEPVIDPNYETALNHWAARVDTFREQLTNPNLTPDQRYEIGAQLKSAEYYLANTLADKGKYYMSPAQLEDYSIYVDALYFPSPSALNGSMETLSTLWSLEKQYASGMLTTDRFLNELDRMAQMIEMENR